MGVYTLRKALTGFSTGKRTKTNFSELAPELEQEINTLKDQYKLFRETVSEGTFITASEYNTFKKSLFGELDSIKALLPDPAQQLKEETKLLRNLMRKLRVEYYKRRISEQEYKARQFDYQERLDFVTARLGLYSGKGLKEAEAPEQKQEQVAEVEGQKKSEKAESLRKLGIEV